MNIFSDHSIVQSQTQFLYVVVFQTDIDSKSYVPRDGNGLNIQGPIGFLHVSHLILAP